VHRKNILIYIQQDATLHSLFYLETAGRQADHEQQHDYHHDTKVKPEAATAVIELLMMGGNTPETC